MSAPFTDLQAMIASARTPADIERVMRAMMSPEQRARQEAFDHWQQLDAQYQADFAHSPIIGMSDTEFTRQVTMRRDRWAEVVAAKEAYEAMF